MSMRLPDLRSLWSLTNASGCSPARCISDAVGRAPLGGHAPGSSLGVPCESLRGQSLLISCERQLPATLALLQLDGIARRLLLCPTDLASEHLPAILAEAQVDAVVSDGTGPAARPPNGVPAIPCGDTIEHIASAPERNEETEWLLFTSGTTGQPKLVVHTLSSLTGPLDDGLAVANDAVWSTFYDIRRYGGLQILLRALLGGGSMVLSQAGESVADFLARAGQSGVTHISGTPSHWRRALMSPASRRISPRYVRLSGEVSDQAI